MYFFNIDELKGHLVRGRNQSPKLYFSLWFIASLLHRLCLGNEISIIYCSLVSIGGLLYCYKINGGKQGLFFFERYFSLFWVYGWRFMGMLLLLYIFLAATSIFSFFGFAILKSLGMEDFSWVAIALPMLLVVATVLIDVYFYYKLGQHIGEVRKRYDNLASD